MSVEKDIRWMGNRFTTSMRNELRDIDRDGGDETRRLELLKMHEFLTNPDSDNYDPTIPEETRRSWQANDEGFMGE